MNKETAALITSQYRAAGKDDVTIAAALEIAGADQDTIYGALFPVAALHKRNLALAEGEARHAAAEQRRAEGRPRTLSDMPYDENLALAKLAEKMARVNSISLPDAMKYVLGQWQAAEIKREGDGTKYIAAASKGGAGFDAAKVLAPERKVFVTKF